MNRITNFGTEKYSYVPLEVASDPPKLLLSWNLVKSRLRITFFTVPKRFVFFHGARKWYCRPLCVKSKQLEHWSSGIILCMRWANERWCCTVTPLIGWARTRNDSCVMGERNFERFEFEISFDRISYIHILYLTCDSHCSGGWVGVAVGVGWVWVWVAGGCGWLWWWWWWWGVGGGVGVGGVGGVGGGGFFSRT